MAKKRVHGTHRVENSPPLEDGVWITDGTIGQEIKESDYVAKDYPPALETLPWGRSTPDGK